jgi:RNA polymerase primary sigma factor
MGTHITPAQVYYRVACECGKQISPSANSMDLVTTPYEDPNPQTVQEIRMDYFLRQVGVEPQRDAMKQQVKESLATIRKRRDRKILTQRFGVDGSEGKSLQEIGDEYGLTRQRVQQIEARLLGLIRYELEKEKHEDRIETPA